ncbi:hypothetical protein Glove_177g99 [Diversispora epigaea]|uniref:Uncharacterized protein n=1 Tax=Diversispora epigaea TaxID=1348612 RepID=A0A397IXY5_9GLOM|nr:hypothetical protein Glove_177g99 [Diversispora epigaea]
MHAKLNLFDNKNGRNKKCWRNRRNEVKEIEEIKETRKTEEMKDIEETKELEESESLENYTGIELNELADKIAKEGCKNGDSTKINPQGLKSVKYFNTVNDKPIDLPIQEYMKEYISINHLIDWKMMYRTTTTLSQWIIIATDWEYTQEMLMYTSITNPETSEEDQKYRTFKVKLFINELPTKQIMHDRQHLNDKPIDLPIQEYMKEYISINHLIDWKMMYRTTTTLSQWIIIATDWEYTQEMLMYTSITNPETSEEDQKYRTFKVKLFINELPTKQIMHDRQHCHGTSWDILGQK